MSYLDFSLWSSSSKLQKWNFYYYFMFGVFGCFVHLLPPMKLFFHGAMLSPYGLLLANMDWCLIYTSVYGILPQIVNFLIILQNGRSKGVHQISRSDINNYGRNLSSQFERNNLHRFHDVIINSYQPLKTNCVLIRIIYKEFITKKTYIQKIHQENNKKKSNYIWRNGNKSWKCRYYYREEKSTIILHQIFFLLQIL